MYVAVSYLLLADVWLLVRYCGLRGSIISGHAEYIDTIKLVVVLCTLTWQSHSRWRT